MEQLYGGNLAMRCPYSEGDAAQIVSKILSAIKCFHDNGMLHLSLNLENVLFTDTKRKEVKLADHGLSRKIQMRSHVREGGEEKNYAAAPETFKGIYSAQSDIWSIGVICFIILSRKAPFSGE